MNMEYSKIIANKYSWNGDLKNLENLIENIANKRKVLVAFSGKMGAGKDANGYEFAQRELNERGIVLQHFSFATPLKDEVQMIADEYNAEDDKPLAKKYGVKVTELRKLIKLLNGKNIQERSPEQRSALQYWGTDVRRKQNPNYWVEKSFEFIVNFLLSQKTIAGFYITDPRFPNEVEMIQDLCGFVVRLNVEDELRKERIFLRDGIVPTKEQLNHISEQSLDDYDFKYVLNENIATARTPEQVITTVYNLFKTTDFSKKLKAFYGEDFQVQPVDLEKKNKVLTRLKTLVDRGTLLEIENGLKSQLGKEYKVSSVIDNNTYIIVLRDLITTEVKVITIETLATLLLSRDKKLLEGKTVDLGFTYEVM